MKKYLSLILVAASALTIAACSPENAEVVDTTGATGITSVSAKFSSGAYVDDANAVFTATVTSADQGTILISIPYYYPQDSDNAVSASTIQRMRVSAALNEGATVYPALGLMDLSQDNHVEVTLASGAKIKYIIKARIDKLSGCSLTSLVLTDENGDGYDCIINDDAATVTASATVSSLSNCTATFETSPHASVTSPDLTATKTWKAGDKISVTAQDGTVKTYTFAISVPSKVDYGIRSGSGTEKWTKTFATDLGITLSGNPVRTAIVGKYVLVANESHVYQLNLNTGAYIGEVTLPEGVTVSSLACDDAGHVLIAADAAFNGTLTVYYVSLTDMTPHTLITYSHADIYSSAIGNIRVRGDVTGTATVSALVDVSQYWVAWQITGGTAATAIFGALPAASQIWSPAGGCVTPAGSKLSDGLFWIGYAGAPYALYYLKNAVSGTATTDWTNEFDTGTEGNENFNCIATADFNGARYVAICQGAHFEYSTAPIVYMFDYSSPDILKDAQVYKLDKSGTFTFVGAGAATDVDLKATSDGYKLNLVWVEGNFGVIGCTQFDCIAR